MILILLVPNINMMWMSLGEWSFVFDDYLEMGLLHYLNLPQFQDMANIIDPLVYANRYLKFVFFFSIESNRLGVHLLLLF
jgi:PhoPQ-activated pathogenicity-related protein